MTRHIRNLLLLGVWSTRAALRGRPRATGILLMLLHLATIGAVTLLVAHQQRRIILDHTRAQALMVGVYLATLQEGALLSYDYARLEQAAAHVAAIDGDLVYLIAHLHDGRVAAFSGHAELQGLWLEDLLSQRALQAAEPLVQEIRLPGTAGPSYEVAVPIYVSGSARKWGTIRLGVSLTRAERLLHRTQRTLGWLSLSAFLGGLTLVLVWARLAPRPELPLRP